MTFVIFDALIFFILAFILFAISTTGRHIMSVQTTIDAVVAQLTKARQEIVQARDELLAGIAEVQEQLDNAEAPEDVDLTALTAAAQSLDDIVPDAPEVPADQPAEVEAPTEDDDTLVDQLP
jgi:hypothetical protein